MSRVSRPPDTTTSSFAWLAALAGHRRRFLTCIPTGLAPVGDEEDILQEAYLKALTTAAGPRDPDHAEAWFARLVHNAAIDRRRSTRSAARRLAAWAADPTTETGALDEAVAAEGSVGCSCLARSLRDLTPMLRDILQRVVVDGAAVSGVAAELGVTTNAARVRLHRARRALRGRLLARCGAAAPGRCERPCACSDTHRPRPATDVAA